MATEAGNNCAPCASLPSSQAVLDFYEGKPGALVNVASSMVLRAGLIGLGMAIAGERKHLVRNSLASAAAIEVFVFAWVAWNRRKAGA